MQLLDNLKWRYATKTFNSTKKISSKELNLLKKSIQLSPSSYGLQPYKILIINNSSLKSKLKLASWNQPQITTASHIFVFCNYTMLPKLEIDNYINLTAAVQKINISDSLLNYKKLIEDDLYTKSNKEIENWSKNQCYIAMSNLLNACAELKIDACPMEGFDNNAYNEILDLNKSHLNSAVIVPIGYRSKDDYTQKRKKIRKSFNQLFISK